MNEICYTLAIKQKTCQSSVNKIFDNVYTNIGVGTDVPLQFGYTLTYLAGTCAHCTIQLSNPIYIPTLNFNIPNDSYKIFDLPCECGTYRVYVGAILSPCTECCSA